MIDKTRVHAGQGHPGKRLDECQKYMVAGRQTFGVGETSSCHRSCGQERLQEEYNIGSAWGEGGTVNCLSGKGGNSLNWTNICRADDNSPRRSIVIDNTTSSSGCRC